MPSSPPGFYKHPRTGVFWIRRRVPSDLVAALGRRIVQETLGTKERRLAEALYSERMGELARTWQALIAAQSAHLSPRTIAALAGEFYRAIVASHEDEPGTPQKWTDAADAMLKVNRPVPRRVNNAYGTAVSKEMLEFIRERGFDYTGAVYRPLLRAFFDAKLLACRTLARRASGDYSPEPDAARFPALVAPTAPVTAVSSTSRLTVADDWDLFAKERDLSAGTQKRWRPILIDLARFIGRDDLSATTPKQVVAWTRELAEPVPGGRGLTPLTISDGYLAAARSFFAWAKGTQVIPANPCDGLRIKIPKGAKGADEEKGFEDAQAALILSESLRPPDPRLSRHMAAARRWVPWLCAYTGARVNELTQLRKMDVRRVVFENLNIWVIRITPEAGTVKDNEARDVPLHPHLVEQGFPEFVASCREGPLFYDPEREGTGTVANPRYRKVGDRLAAWVREIGVDGDVAPNHGWRHRFSTVSRLVRMCPEVRSRIKGHAAKTEGERYGSHLIQVKYREICLLPQYEVQVPTAPRQATEASRKESERRMETAKRAYQRVSRPAASQGNVGS